MKICTICNQTYTNDQLNYCLADGGLLNDMTDDAPPTMMMGQAKPTNQTWQNEPSWAEPGDLPKTQQNLGNQANWGNQPAAPVSPWQNQPISPMNQPYMAPMPYGGQNQTMAIVSMILGILSLPLG